MAALPVTLPVTLAVIPPVTLSAPVESVPVVLRFSLPKLRAPVESVIEPELIVTVSRVETPVTPKDVMPEIVPPVRVIFEPSCVARAPTVTLTFPAVLNAISSSVGSARPPDASSLILAMF